MKLTAWPEAAGLALDEIAVVVAARLTDCARAADVLPANDPSPEYAAAIECEPTDRADVNSAAWPVASTGTTPSVAALSVNVTVPRASRPPRRRRSR